MPHSLVEIPRQHWPQLRDLYVAHRKSSSAYNLLQCFMDWAEQNAALDVKLYDCDHGAMYGNSLSDRMDRLVTAFNCLDSSKSYLICGFPDRVLPAVRRHFLDSGLTEDDLQLVNTYWYHLDKQRAQKCDATLPPGYTFRCLAPAYAEMVDDHWPHKGPATIHYIDRLIRYNDSVGVFDGQDCLIAWCLILPHGALGMLQVLGSHKRRGLGSCIIRYMAKLVAAKNLEVLAPVVFENNASRTMFETLGFSIVDQVYWVLKPAKDAKL